MKIEDIKVAFLNPLYIFYNIMDLNFPNPEYQYISTLCDILDNLFDTMIVYKKEDVTFSKLLKAHGLTDELIEKVDRQNYPLALFLQMVDVCKKDILKYQMYLASHIRIGESTHYIVHNYYRLLKGMTVDVDNIVIELKKHYRFYNEDTFRKLAEWMQLSILTILNELVKVETKFRSGEEMSTSCVDVKREPTGELVIVPGVKDDIVINDTNKKSKKELRENVNQLDKDSGVRLKHPEETVDTDYKFKRKVEKYKQALATLLFALNEVKMKNQVDKKSVYGTEVKDVAIDKKFMKKSIWFNKQEVEIQSQEFRMRFITYIIAWVIKNLARLAEISFEYNKDGDFIEYESKLDYVQYIAKRTMEFVTKISNNQDFGDDLIYFETLMILLDTNKDNYKKNRRKINNLRVQINNIINKFDHFIVTEQDITMDTILKLAYMVTTNDPKVKGRVVFNGGYKFYKRRETKRMLHDLGVSILKSRKKYSVPELFKFFVYADPIIYSQWEDVNDDLYLGVGIIAARFLAYMIPSRRTSEKICNLL